MVEKLDGCIDGYGFLYSWSVFFPLWVKGGCIWSSIWQSTSRSQQRGRDRYTGDYMLPTTFIITLSQTKIWTFVRFQNQLWNEFRTLKSYICHGQSSLSGGVNWAQEPLLQSGSTDIFVEKLSLQKWKKVFLEPKWPLQARFERWCSFLLRELGYYYIKLS